MSIKSQKSLNEECSEIFERSYSVRSVSEESLSCDDEDQYLARELMNKLTPAVLSKLRRCFRKNKERSHAQDIDRRVEEVMRMAAAEEGIEFASSAPPPEDKLWLDEKAFVAALNNIFGHHKYSTHAQKLFQLLDAFSTGKVWWRQLVSKLVAVGARKTRSRAEVWTPIGEPSVRRLEHCKRETIVKLVCVEGPDSFCYVAVSKGGRVGVYSGELNLLHSYEMFFHRSGLARRVKNRWITDAVYLPDVQCMVMSASDRSLSIYDATTIAHAPLYCITGLPNIPTCLAYSPSCTVSASSELSFGTELGDVIRLRFLQPRMQLMHVSTPDAVNYYFWMELSSPPHTSYCSISYHRRAHSRYTRRVWYSREGSILVSCSHDSGASVRAKHVPGKMEDYVFKVHAGVTCFHIISSLQLLATGSCDGIVRLWGTSQSQPFAKLHAGTTSPVLDIAVIPANEIVIAFCNNCMLHIWDLYEECLLQTIKIQFPFLGVLGKKVEFGTYCIHPGPTRKEPEVEPPEVPELSSRRSSVYQGSTGGLMLQLADGDHGKRRLDDEPEYSRFSRSELVVSCCDHVCIVSLSRSRGAPVPPPADSLRPRRPSLWDLPDYPLMDTSSAISSPRQQPKSRASLVFPPLLLSPSTAEFSTNDLETLLDNAGLKGILEKDFVLMQGLKNDLNRKLADIEANKETMLSAVNACAPYLGLRTHEPTHMEPADERTEQYRRIMRLFPDSSMATPTGSEKTSPRPTPRQNLDSTVDVCGYEMTSDEEFFKFYSDDSAINDKYRPLGEKDYTRFISSRSARREPAVTRQITSLAYKVGKEMISLAEGMPNEQAFPFTRFSMETRGFGTMEMEGDDLAAALQYVPSQGLPPLLSELRKFQSFLHRPPPLPRDVLVTNGSQHGIYQCVELLLEVGDPVITTEFAYTGIHSTLKPYQPEIIGVPEDENGMLPETLDSILGERLLRGLKMPKMLYIIPTGSNPSGTVLSEERRRQIYELACRYDFLIIEDDPYMFLNYSETRVPSFLSMDICGRVIRLDSISKVVSAGLRGAWLSAPAPLLRRLELHSQAELLHPCTLSQSILLRVLSNRSALATHLRSTRDFYRHRRDLLHRALTPASDLATCHLPEAGLFFWMRVAGVEDVYNMVFHTAFQRGLMLVPGQAFLHDSHATCPYVRLTFSKVRVEDMDTAVAHLADIIREEQHLNKQRVATEG